MKHIHMLGTVAYLNSENNTSEKNRRHHTGNIPLLILAGGDIVTLQWTLCWQHPVAYFNSEKRPQAGGGIAMLHSPSKSFVQQVEQIVNMPMRLETGLLEPCMHGRWFQTCLV